MKRIIKCGADFIYRYHHGFKYYDITTGKVIDIYKLVKGKENLKVRVKIGGADGPIVTLLAEKVNEQIADKRRCQLKNLPRQYPANKYYDSCPGPSSLPLLKMNK
ncbi:MAG: hypothetical protein IPG01_03000 [Chitinophagaceae bacterium]|nr:hypothetical protein [Chitinophagaceae bacterium]